MTDEFLPGLMLGLIAGALLGALLISGLMADNWRNDVTGIKGQAVSRGYAEYFVDDKYQPQWRWK